MTGIVTNARQVAAIFADRSKRWDSALSRAMRRALAAVEGAAADRLTGGGAPMSYPVPVRTGFLRRSLGSKLLGVAEGMVFNTADYAHAVHSGRIGIGGRRKGTRIVKPRPFLEDALKAADPGRLIFEAMEKAL